MKRSVFVPVLALGASLVACGSDDLSEEESQRAFSAALSVGALGGAEASGTVTSEEGTFTYSCPGGGSASFSGVVTSSSEEFDWTISYNACVTDGVTIDGQIRYMGSATETSVSFTMDGDLDFSGAIEGDCEIDVEWSTDASSNDVSFDYTGSICGYDASVAGDVSF